MEEKEVNMTIDEKIATWDKTIQRIGDRDKLVALFEKIVGDTEIEISPTGIEWDFKKLAWKRMKINEDELAVLKRVYERIGVGAANIKETDGKFHVNLEEDDDGRI